MSRFFRRDAAAAPSAGLDFTHSMRLLCRDMVCRLPELSHVDMDLVAVRVCQTRARGLHGVHASLTPLRFEGGSPTQVRRGRVWTIQGVVDAAGREMLYLLSFYLPRFCNQPLVEKLATVIHELWHIGPAFDGDVRRFPGRCFAHGRSEADFHNQMHARAKAWLALAPPVALYAFLDGDFQALRARYQRIYGTKIATPKLVPQPPAGR